MFQQHDFTAGDASSSVASSFACFAICAWFGIIAAPKVVLIRMYHD